MPNTTSQHILNTSANLLGFCLFVITAFHIADRQQKTLIDEFTGVVAILLAVSCFFSFSSIRSKKERRQRIFENIADLLFMLSLLGILVIIVFITLHFVK
jgi:hypothetical protein